MPSSCAVWIDRTKAYTDISLRSWIAVRFIAVQEVLGAHTIDTLTYATGIEIIEYYVLYSIRIARILHIKCFVMSLPV